MLGSGTNKHSLNFGFKGRLFPQVAANYPSENASTSDSCYFSRTQAHALSDVLCTALTSQRFDVPLKVEDPHLRFPATLFIFDTKVVLESPGCVAVDVVRFLVASLGGRGAWGLGV